MTSRGVSTVTKSALFYGASRRIVNTNEEYRNSSSSYSSSEQSSQPSNSNRPTNSSGKSKPCESLGSSGSGGKPPNNNPNNNKKEHYEEQTETHWKTFLKIFNVEELDAIIVKGEYIFKNIGVWQKKELKDFIVSVNNRYDYFNLNEIMNLTLKLLDEVGQDDVTSHNFVNIAKFVLAYLCQELNEHHEAFRDPTRNFTTSRAEHAETIISRNDNTILQIFKNLMIEITELSANVDPQFVNTIAGVYHYFKHKFIKHINILLTPAEYFQFASKWQKRLKEIPKFKKLMEAGTSRIVYEIYNAKIGRRLQIIIKRQGGKWNLSSCYFTDNIYEGDKDGDEWINKEKLPRK